MKRIAVFASGGGTDFQSVIDANAKEHFCEIVCLIASKAGIGAIERAQRCGIPHAVYAKKDYPDIEELYRELAYRLNMQGVDYIVLAGWLKIIPQSFIEAFKDRIINIHPSLIPAFCGRGMYGLRVHEAVLGYGAKVTGATVHFVTGEPDGGPIVLQKAVDVLPCDTPESLQKRVMEQCEHLLLPRAVALFCQNRLSVDGRKVTIL